MSHYTTVNHTIVSARTLTTLKAALAHFLKCIVCLLFWEVFETGGEGLCAKWREINL